MDLQKSLDWLEENKEIISDISKDIWSFAETAFVEYESSKLIAQTLEDHGFDVELGYAGLPTAIRATYGTGKPVVGFLGEYDALPGMSQEVATEKQPREEGKPGHGCGHNLLGVAPLGSALALRYGMESEDEMTIVYYGCPAEELLIGKGYMAREGAFQDLDFAISWHPMGGNYVLGTSMTAIETARFHFKGKTAHAAADPWNGRSALDAAELMTTGVQYLREHVEDGVRMHYIFEEAGEAPNIVPDKSSLYFFVRAQNRNLTVETFDRMVKCAEGSSIMTETTYEMDKVGGCYEIMPNKVLNNVLVETFEEAPGLEFTEEEYEFAEEINKHSPKYEAASAMDNYTPLNTDFVGVVTQPVGGSSDVGDVSHICPLVFFCTTTQNSLAPNHSWDNVSCNGMSIGQKGMLYASDIMVRFVDKVLADEEILKEAQEEFDREIVGQEYVCPIDDDMDYKDNLK